LALFENRPLLETFGHVIVIDGEPVG
jgi:hypothetical protein